MSDPLTNYINSTEELVDFAFLRLSESTHWNAYKLASMNPALALEMNPDMRMPSVAVTHESSSFGNFPRRTAVITATVCVEAASASGEFTARELADEVISLLDNQIFNGAHFRIRSYQAIASDPCVAMHRLEFNVEDN